jgi:nucleoside-diphosphate-sugar epimerase
VNRIVYASSITVALGYEAVHPYGEIFHGRAERVGEESPFVSHAMPTRPTSLYSASKIWGEALAQIYAYRHGISCLCLRIGWVVAEDRPRPPRLGGDWCSQRDIVQIVQKCIDALDNLNMIFSLGFPTTVIDLSISIMPAMLGYIPHDRAEGENRVDRQRLER